MNSLTQFVNWGYHQAYRIAYPVVNFSRRFYRSDGVVMAVWARDRILIVRHSYKPGLGIPGGGMRRNESVLNAAVRELGEELGSEVASAVQNANGVRYPQRRLTRHPGTNYFIEFQLDFEPQIVIDGREIIYAEFLSPAEIDLSECDRYFCAYLEMRNRQITINCTTCDDTKKIVVRVDGEVTCPDCGYPDSPRYQAFERQKIASV